MGLIIRLIVDEKNDFKVVAYPYKKFFNYHEKYAAELDWPSIKVYDKVGEITFSGGN